MTATKKINIKEKVKKESKTPKLVTSLKIPKTNWELENFLKECTITKDDLKESFLEWKELAAIYNEHKRRMKNLNEASKYFAERLRTVKTVHTIRYRIKSPKNLVKKIIRKNIETKKKRIDFYNYKNEITDLIGLRALHLFKEDWKSIHDFIINEWELNENPIAYIREGDRKAWIEQFEKNGCTIKKHPRNYRSIHYIAKSKPSKITLVAEIQVRTIFEEGWSEIDHRINYPHTCSPIAIFFLDIFNRLAGSSDEMGSFLNQLVQDIIIRDATISKLALEKNKALKNVENLVGKLEMSENIKNKLEAELNNLRLKENLTQSLAFGVEDKPTETQEELFKIMELKENICKICRKKYIPSSFTYQYLKICPDCMKKYF